MTLLSAFFVYSENRPGNVLKIIMETYIMDWNSSLSIYYVLCMICEAAPELTEQSTHFTNTFFPKHTKKELFFAFQYIRQCALLLKMQPGSI